MNQLEISKRRLKRDKLNFFIRSKDNLWMHLAVHKNPNRPFDLRVYDLLWILTYKIILKSPYFITLVYFLYSNSILYSDNYVYLHWLRKLQNGYLHKWYKHIESSLRVNTRWLFKYINYTFVTIFNIWMIYYIFQRCNKSIDYRLSTKRDTVTVNVPKVAVVSRRTIIWI